MFAESQVINNVFKFFIDILMKVFDVIISVIFVNNGFTVMIALVLINILAVILMKKDKEYAKNPKAKRIRESTLLTVALIGGALGEYYAMYKYKHKTLHNKFCIGVPIIIVLHFSIISYNILISLLA